MCYNIFKKTKKLWYLKSQYKLLEGVIKNKY